MPRYRLIDDLLHQAGLHSLALSPDLKTQDDATGPFAGPEGQVAPIETAYAPVGRPGSITGPRGRDPGGYPKTLPAGMPPAVFGEFRRNELPKDLEIPARPMNTASFIARAALATGDIIDEEVSFPVRTLMVDNYSAVWIYVDGVQRWLTPHSAGWCLPMLRAQSKVHISGSAPGGHTQPSVTAGDVINVWAYEALLQYSAGTATATT